MSIISTGTGLNIGLAVSGQDEIGTIDSGKLANVVEDTSPQLGGNLDLNGNNITGTGNINITGTINATGNVNLGDNAGSDIITLGGSLNVNGNKIISASSANIDLEPGTGGKVLLGNYVFNALQTVGSGTDNYVLKYDNSTGEISLEALASTYTDSQAVAAVEAEDPLNLAGDVNLSKQLKLANDAAYPTLSGDIRPRAATFDLGFDQSVTPNIDTFRNLHLNGSVILANATDGAAGDISSITNNTGGVAVTATSATSLKLAYSDDGATSGPDIVLDRTSTSPAQSDLLGSIVFKGKDAAGNTDTYSSISGQIEKTNSGGERGRIRFNCIADGSDETVMTMNRNGLFFGANNKIGFAGTTDNNNFITLQAASDPAGFRTVGLPDADGTVVYQDTTDTLTNKTLTNPVISQIVSVSNGNIELDPNGTGNIVLDAKTSINGVRTEPNTLFIQTDMSSDTSDDLHNSIQCQLDYTGSTIGSGTRQNSITFGFIDDAVDLQAGRFNCEFTSADTTSNKMKLIAIDNSTSSPRNGQIDITPKRGAVNVPFEFESYTVADLPTNVGAGAMAYCTDETGGAVPVFYDGSNWRRVTDRAVAS